MYLLTVIKTCSIFVFPLLSLFVALSPSFFNGLQFLLMSSLRIQIILLKAAEERTILLQLTTVSV